MKTKNPNNGTNPNKLQRMQSKVDAAKKKCDPLRIPRKDQATKVISAVETSENNYHIKRLFPLTEKYPELFEPKETIPAPIAETNIDTVAEAAPVETEDQEEYLREVEFYNSCATDHRL
jgi:hypothetical protein